MVERDGFEKRLNELQVGLIDKDGKLKFARLRGEFFGLMKESLSDGFYLKAHN